ncbi:unnamed protein product, partial [Prorocentrum cordatum]
ACLDAGAAASPGALADAPLGGAARLLFLGALVPNMARQGGGPRAGLRAARRAAGALRPTVLHPGRRVPAGARRGEAAGARRGGPKPVAEPRPRGGDRALRASAAAAGGRQGCARCPPAVRGRAEK